MIMDQELEHSIKRIYPTGLLWERDDSQLGFNNQNFRISKFIDELLTNLPLRVAHQNWNDPSYEFAITHKDTPLFDEWVWRMGNQEKLDWIKSNGAPYVVLLLRISRVANYYIYHYNHWKPRGDTGYLDADFRDEPESQWKQYETEIHASLERCRFVLASTEFLRTRIPFLLDAGYDEIPEDDPRWDVDEFNPPPVPCTLFKCMFRKY